MDTIQPVASEADTAPAGATPDQPVAAGERIVALDFVRGVAVLGILFPNVVAHGYPFLAWNSSIITIELKM